MTIMTLRNFFKTEWFRLPLFVAACVIGFALVKYGIIYPARHAANEVYLWLAGLLFVALTYHVRMADLPKATRIILKMLFALFSVYVLVGRPTLLAYDIPFGAMTKMRLLYGPFLFALLCWLGFWRPAFGVMALIAVKWQRFTLGLVLQTNLSGAEYMTLIEMSVFILVGVALLPLARRLNLGDTPGQPTLIEKITLFGIAIHFSNYFYSGIKKFMLGDNPFSWALHNDTWNLMLVAVEQGIFPLSFNDHLASVAVVAFQHSVLIGNLTIFIGQLLAVLAVLRVRWMMWITIFYDLTHAAIFLAAGIFFYKWIFLNIAIIIALRTLSNSHISKVMQACMVAIVICAPVIFFISNLGWFDTRSFNNEIIYAVTDDGRRVRVPSNYWQTFSIHYAQTRRIRDKSDGFFPTGTTAVVFNQRIMEKANKCGFKLPPDSASDVLTKLKKNPDNPLALAIRRHHRYVLAHVDGNGHINYDVYPHHIWSMPWEFRDFAALDKRRIRSYIYEIQAVCLGFKDGAFTRKLMRKGSYDIRLDR